MLTRLKVSGFKNLVDVDVRFGPFTCIAGTNGVGKSNLFDAIRFLSALANHTFVQAAQLVREGKTADIRGLFHRVGDHYDGKMSFEAEMIVPAEGEDDLGQKAQASITFLRYTLELVQRRDDGHLNLGGLELRKEELAHFTIGASRKHLLFPNKPSWRNSVVKGRQVSPLISTDGDEEKTGRVQIRLHQNRGSKDGGGGRPTSLLATTLPRTVLSVANAAEHRTALLARREMESWRLLQLEPSALREPDSFTAPAQLGPNGSHLAAMLYRLGRQFGDQTDKTEFDSGDSDVFAKLANRLSELIDDVREVEIDRDTRRELLTVVVKGRDGTAYPARALSDGTLRFLALAAIELDPTAQGVLCLEEPENGIHPARIPAMLRLLQDIATDTEEPVGPDNPLRQVIVNTHSPAVVAEVPEDSLIVADLRETVRVGERFRRASFSFLEGTWRDTKEKASDPVNVIAKGDLLPYLNPIPPPSSDLNGHRTTRVIDRPELQQLFRFVDDAP
jgi:predicted ATPase